LGRAVHEQQDVDVRARLQLAAAVAADGHQRRGAQRRAAIGAPELLQEPINQLRARVHQRLDRLIGKEADLELLVRLGKQLA
jgi:hypothetical protein